MQLRHWSILNLSLRSALLAFAWQPIFADELLPDQMNEARSISVGEKPKCEIFEPGSAAVKGSSVCIKTSNRIAGHVRVDMSSRLPSGSGEVWPGGQILPVRAVTGVGNSQIPGHLHLGANDVSKPPASAR